MLIMDAFAGSLSSMPGSLVSRNQKSFPDPVPYASVVKWWEENAAKVSAERWRNGKRVAP